MKKRSRKIQIYKCHATIIDIVNTGYAKLKNNIQTMVRTQGITSMEFSLTAQKQKTNRKEGKKTNNHLIQNLTIVSNERISRILLTKKML